jgi:hypothetical protein
MYREYDLFEKFTDGSSLWRASVQGLEGTYVHMRELARKSGNQFYAIDMTSGKIVHSKSERVGIGHLDPSKVGRRSNSAAA